VKEVKLTRRAERRLKEIAAWTISRFGPAQADQYERQLIERLHALAIGELPKGRACDVLVQGLTEATGLRYIQLGGHFIIYRETGDEIQVIDFVHGARDIESIVNELGETES
jgi:plasmid stabilization system protein ParE